MYYTINTLKNQHYIPLSLIKKSAQLWNVSDVVQPKFLDKVFPNNVYWEPDVHDVHLLIKGLINIGC